MDAGEESILILRVFSTHVAVTVDQRVEYNVSLNYSSTMILISVCFVNSNDCGKRAVRQAHHTICTGSDLEFLCFMF